MDFTNHNRTDRTEELPSVERLERALVLAAYIVVRHGPQFAPIVERLESELAAALRDDPVERARRILQRYSVNGRRESPDNAAAALRLWQERKEQMADENLRPETRHEDRLIGIREVCARLSIGVSTLKKWVAEGKFPKGIVLGPTVVRWSEQTVSEWIEERKRGG